MVDLNLVEDDRPEAVLARWRWRILCRAGMSESLARRVATTGEIDPQRFSELVRCGCEPATAVRILAPDGWTSATGLDCAGQTYEVAS